MLLILIRMFIILNKKRPCWNDILSKMDDALYCFTIGDNQGIKDIKNIDYKAYSDDLISSNSAKYSAPLK